MAEKKTIERELLDATGEKPKRQKENPGEYLVRVAEKTSSLPDEEYEALSPGAKGWFTEAAEVLNTDSPDASQIKPFTEFESTNEAGGEDDAVTTTDEEEQTPVATTKDKGTKKDKLAKKEETEAKKPAAAVEVKKTKPAAAKKETAPKKEAGPKPVRETSVADTIRGLMCANSDLSKEDVAKELNAKKMSFETSRLDQIYHATARVLDLLKQLKKLK